MSDFDFFGGTGGPSTPPPAGPPPGGQFGAPPTNQFGTPPTNQFGTPVAPPAPVSNDFAVSAAPTVAPVAPPPGAYTAAEKRNPWLMVGAVIVVIVLAVVGWMWILAEGKKTTTKATTAIETPIVKAHQIEATVDLQQASIAMETYLADHGTYPTAIAQLPGFMASPSDSLVVVSAGPTAYCLRADDTSNFHSPSMYLASGQTSASATPCT